jgi:hypothetical protein
VAAGAGKAPRRPSGGRQRPTGARREAAEHEQGAGWHGTRLAVGSNSSAAPVGAGVRRWAEKTTLNSFSPNLRVGHGLPDPPCRSAPAYDGFTAADATFLLGSITIALIPVLASELSTLGLAS